MKVALTLMMPLRFTKTLSPTDHTVCLKHKIESILSHIMEFGCNIHIIIKDILLVY